MSILAKIFHTGGGNSLHCTTYITHFLHVFTQHGTFLPIRQLSREHTSCLWVFVEIAELNWCCIGKYIRALSDGGASGAMAPPLFWGWKKLKPIISWPPFKTKKKFQNLQGKLIYHSFLVKKLKKNKQLPSLPLKKIRLLWLFTFAKKRYHFLGKKLLKKFWGGGRGCYATPPSSPNFFFFAGPTTFKMPERALILRINCVF